MFALMIKYIITTIFALVFSFNAFANTSWDDILNAKNYFNKAININPKHLPSYINLGHLENNLNHSKKAADHYLKAYNLNNNLEEVLTYHVLSLSAQGKFVEAKKIILELNKKFPENVKSYQLYSKIHKYTLEDTHQKLMLSKISNPSLNHEDLSNLHFALAKSFYDQKNVEKFVHHTNRGDVLLLCGPKPVCA